MRESVRKLGLIGAGLWAMTEEKIDEFVKERLLDKDIFEQKILHCLQRGGFFNKSSFKRLSQ